MPIKTYIMIILAVIISAGLTVWALNASNMLVLAAPAILVVAILVKKRSS